MLPQMQSRFDQLIVTTIVNESSFSVYKYAIYMKCCFKTFESPMIAVIADITAN